MSSSFRKALCCTGAALGAWSSASADNWDFNPRVEVGGTYNDNYRLAEQGQEKLHVYGPMVDALFSMRSLTPRSELSIIPRVHSTFFPSDHDDQSTDGFLDAKGDWRTPKSDFNVLGQYANEEVITSQLLAANFPGVNLGQIVGGETGRVSVRNREQLERLVPAFTYELAPREHLHLDAEYVHASFDKSTVQLIGFSNIYGSAGLGFDLTQRQLFTVTALASRFMPDQTNHDTNHFGIQTQWDLRQSQVMHLYLRLGADRTNAQTSTGTVGTTGITGGAGVSWTYQITQYVVDALRGITPSAAGAVVNHDELRFRYLRALRPRLSGFLGARAVRLRGANNGALAVQGSDYLAANGGFQYQITRDYRVSGEYDFTWQRFQGEPRASSNAVALSFIYQPLSRYEPLPELYGLPTGRPNE